MRIQKLNNMSRFYTPVLFMILSLSISMLYSCDPEPKEVKEKEPKPALVKPSTEELNRIGQLIYQNEASAKAQNLTVWNEGEDFPSMGIGHFIWYPKGVQGPFHESFPLLLQFIEQSGKPIPEWIEQLPDREAPWYSRDQFYESFNSPEMARLRQFLIDTMPEQTEFLAKRLEDGLSKILAHTPPETKEQITAQFYRVANSPMGIYALIDYVNFKGEGVLETERYNGQGWGLLQVLEQMNGSGTGLDAVEEYSRGAEFVLTRRVHNAPPERNESRWLVGWKNRIATYGAESRLAISRDTSQNNSTNTVRCETKTILYYSYPSCGVKQ